MMSCRRMLLPLCLLSLAHGLSHKASRRRLPPSPPAAPANLSRRASLAALASVVTAFLPHNSPATAFENKISNKYDDRPKRRGPQPKDLGVRTRISLEADESLGLRNCGAAPNCFCSTMVQEEDPDHWIPSWQWPEKLDQTQAFADLNEVLKSYPPGQNGVDGGGFSIQKVADGYIYVVYEALKNGYHDDVEFAYIAEQQVPQSIQVRSSSRVGYLDYGVNAKRLNWIAKELRSRGWDAIGVDYKTHQGYVMENQL